MHHDVGTFNDFAIDNTSLLKIREWMSYKATFLLFLARMRCIVVLRIEILDENRGNVVQQIAAHEFCKRLTRIGFYCNG